MGTRGLPEVATPSEAGEPTSSELKAGAIGQVLLVISAVLISLTNYATSYAYDLYLETSAFWTLVVYVSAFIFFLFSVGFWISARKVVRLFHGGGPWILLVVFGVAPFGFLLLPLLWLLSGTFIVAGVMIMLYTIFLALTSILVGVFFIMYRRRSPNTEMWLLTGILYLVGGIAGLPNGISYFFYSGYSALLYISAGQILPATIGAVCFSMAGGRRYPETVRFARGDLLVGAFGMGVLVISAGTFVLGYFSILLSPVLIYPTYFEITAPFGLISSALFLGFAVLVGISMVKIEIKFGANPLGVAATLVGMLAAVAGMLYYGLTITGNTLTNSPTFLFGDSLNSLGFVLSTTYSLLAGTTIILLGSFLLLRRENGSNAGLWMAGGLVYTIVGSYGLQIGFTSLEFAPIGLLVSGVIGVVCFLGKGDKR